MAQRKVPDQQEGNEAKENGAKRSREFLLTKFVSSADLTTLQIEETILHSDRDQDRGALRFSRLMSNLLEQARLLNIDPTFIWLISDVTQLLYVLQAMKQSHAEDFAELQSTSAIFLIDPSSKKRQLLSRGPDPSTLTAFPNGKGGYEYYRHVKPTDPKDWQEGPYCSHLPNTPKGLDEFVQQLHQARIQKLKGEGSDVIQQLADVGVKTLGFSEFLI